MGTLTLTTGTTELQARGFDYLSATRCTYFLNSAKDSLNEAADWPWLETTTTGTAPLTISDCRQILYVIDTTQKLKLRSLDVRNITDIDTDVTTAGTPAYWWLDGLTTLKVYPTSTTDSLSVRYLKHGADLSSGSDTPLHPARFDDMWIDLACIRAYVDSDNLEAAQALQNKVQGDLQDAMRVMFSREGDYPEVLSVSYSYDG